MENEIFELAKYRLEKAKKDLESAKLNFKSNFLSQSINRSYYSIFHSVRALLSFDRFDSKKHSGIIAYFNQHFVKAGKFEKVYSETLMSAERIRINTDYDDFYVVSKEQAELQLTNAEKFIKGIEEFIKANYN